MPTNPYEPPKGDGKIRFRRKPVSERIGAAVLIAVGAVAFALFIGCVGILGGVFFDMLDGELPFMD